MDVWAEIEIVKTDSEGNVITDLKRKGVYGWHMTIYKDGTSEIPAMNNGGRHELDLMIEDVKRFLFMINIPVKVTIAKSRDSLVPGKLLFWHKPEVLTNIYFTHDCNTKTA